MRRLGSVQSVLHATVNLGAQVETGSNNTTEPTKTSSYLGKIWNEHDVQVMVLISLALQLFLLFAGNVRRRYRVSGMRFLVWMAYLAAFAVPVSTIGLFSQYEDKYRVRSPQSSSDSLHTIMMPFLWAPFLLLHLGGPDTITAFSMEDNNLWTRQLLSLVTQLGLALYVFWKSFDLLDSQLLAVAVPLFVAGIIKYGERIWALRRGSRDDHDFRSQKDSMQPATNRQARPNPYFKESRALESALSSRGLLAGRTLFQLGPNALIKVLEHFEGEANLELILMELSMIYDMLYTKAMVLQSWTGGVFRCIALIAMMAAFVLFWVNQHLRAHRTTNAAITYTLFVAAIFMEVYSIFMLIASPWTRARFKFLRSISGKLACCFPSQGVSSPSIGQFNLVDYSLSTKSRPKFISIVSEGLGLEKHWRNFWYVKHVKDKEIVGLVFNTDPNGFSERSQHLELGMDLKYLLKLPFEHALFRLHISTEMYLSPLDGVSSEDAELTELVAQCRKLSNYLMYLMAVYPSMLPVSSATEDLMFVFAQWVRENHDNQTKAWILDKYVKDKLNNETQFRHFISPSALPAPRDSLKELKEVWARLLMYAAGKCRMELHAQQLSSGVELLTVASLLMIYKGLGDVGIKELDLLELTERERIVSLNESNFTILSSQEGPLYAFQFPQEHPPVEELQRRLQQLFILTTHSDDQQPSTSQQQLRPLYSGGWTRGEPAQFTPHSVQAKYPEESHSSKNEDGSEIDEQLRTRFTPQSEESRFSKNFPFGSDKDVSPPISPSQDHNVDKVGGDKSPEDGDINYVDKGEAHKAKAGAETEQTEKAEAPIQQAAPLGGAYELPSEQHDDAAVSKGTEQRDDVTVSETTESGAPPPTVTNVATEYLPGTGAAPEVEQAGGNHA